MMKEDSVHRTSQHNSALYLQNDIYNHTQFGDNQPLNLNSLLSKLQGQVSNSQWYQFGLALGVPKKALNELEQYSQDARLIEMLDCWLKHHPGRPTWQEVAEAQRKIDSYQLNDDMEEYSKQTHSYCDNNYIIHAFILFQVV